MRTWETHLPQASQQHKPLLVKMQRLRPNRTTKCWKKTWKGCWMQPTTVCRLSWTRPLQLRPRQRPLRPLPWTRPPAQLRLPAMRPRPLLPRPTRHRALQTSRHRLLQLLPQPWMRRRLLLPRLWTRQRVWLRRSKTRHLLRPPCWTRLRLQKAQRELQKASRRCRYLAKMTWNWNSSDSWRKRCPQVPLRRHRKVGRPIP
mmetsp:Transcript_51147/g.70992  ORF Transcript_51147/g.70992 Transcript_51147/m.70992 type:complete len:201 (-) Transcript_51147:375-977(-)